MKLSAARVKLPEVDASIVEKLKKVMRRDGVDYCMLTYRDPVDGKLLPKIPHLFNHYKTSHMQLRPTINCVFDTEENLKRFVLAGGVAERHRKFRGESQAFMLHHTSYDGNAELGWIPSENAYQVTSGGEMVIQADNVGLDTFENFRNLSCLVFCTPSVGSEEIVYVSLSVKRQGVGFHSNVYYGKDEGEVLRGASGECFLLIQQPFK